MSRSIHTTRRDVEEAKKAQYADSQRRAEEINKLRDEIKKKQRIKHRVSSERKEEIEHQFVTPPESIPIQMRDGSDYVHYPASPDDLLGVMHLLPAGVLDGVEAIDLILGKEDQAERFSLDSTTQPDPLTGRLGNEDLPGIYSGNCLGSYYPKLNRISIFAYVYDPNLPNRTMWEIYLRLMMLSTFIHEVAHHYDFTMRTDRGRWLMDDRSKGEMYAEKIQHDWMHQYVIPYLEQTYSEPLQELDAWICQHGGVSIPLSKLAGDPRVTAKNGFIYIDKTDFGIPSAFHTLAEDVVKGESLIDTHIQFARGLHYGENYVEAMEILDKLLTTETDNLEAITLKAEIYGHEEKYDLALPLIERVLAVDKTIRNAWEILADICEFRCDWKGLLNATDYILDNFELSTTSAARLLLDHAHARKELGDIAGMEIDLEDVEAIEWTRQRPPYIQRRIDEIRDQPKDTDN